MQPAATPREFVRAPLGRYVAGRSWLAFCVDERLAGVVVWGSPDADDARALTQVLPLRRSPLATRMLRLVDLRRLVGIGPDAFAIIVEHFGSDTTAVGRIVERAAIVHASSFGAALGAGFAHAALISVPTELFGELRAALVWLGVDASLEQDLDRLRAEVVGVPPLLLELRAFVRAKLRDVSLPAVAVALGMSPRSLQRRLRDERSSFQREVNAARVEAAQTRMLESDTTISEVAAEVGFASTNRFGELFRRATGETPATWRARRRGP